MGAGRKTKTLPLQEKVERRHTINSSVSARNLRKGDLGAVVFGCKHSTIEECEMKNLFGLPSQHFSYVKNVTPGLVLFLFNYSDRKLHGIFEATSQGQLNIDPHGWTVDGAGRTPYPAQAQVRVRNQCRPLVEEEFRPVIADNYYERRHFWFELDRTQTSKLIQLFLSSPLPFSRYSYHLQNAAARSMLHNALPVSDTKEIAEWDTWEKNAADLKPEGECSYASVPVSKNNSVPQKSWTSLFKASAASEGEAKEAILKPQTSKLELLLDNPNLELDASCLSLSLHREDQGLGGCADEWDTNISETPLRKEIGFLKSKASELDLPHVDEPNTEWESSCGTQVAPLDTFGGNDAIDINSDLEIWVKDSGTQQCDLLSMIHQLVQEIEELKGSQLQKDLKIDSLEQQMNETKLEIQDLRKKCKFDSGRTSFPSAILEEVDLEAHDLFSQPDGTILVIGGYDGSRFLSDLSLYSPTYDLVKSLKPMSFLRSYFSAAWLNDELYLFGGVNADTWYDTVESYNLNHNQWVTRPQLNQKKGHLAGVSVFDKLFAIGGGDGIDCFSEVEMFDMTIGKWIFTKSMQQKRFAPAVATIDGSVYVVGGYDGKKYLKSVERFDSREPKWTQLQSMSTPRGGHSLAALDEKLYALGGYNGKKIVSTVEIFDPRVCSWMVGEPMEVARAFSAAAVMGGKIYAIGGMNDDDQNILESVECYKEGYGWTMTNLKTLGKRSSFSALVL